MTTPGTLPNLHAVIVKSGAAGHTAVFDAARKSPALVFEGDVPRVLSDRTTTDVEIQS